MEPSQRFVGIFGADDVPYTLCGFVLRWTAYSSGHDRNLPGPDWQPELPGCDSWYEYALRDLASLQHQAEARLVHAFSRCCRSSFCYAVARWIKSINVVCADDAEWL